MDSNHWEEFPLNHLITQEEDPRAITQIIITYFRNNNIDINTKFGGYNCLHYAASTSNGLLMQNLEIYYSEEIDFNATTIPGNETALHLVIQRNDPSTLREFLRANIDPNIHRKVDGRTALHLAVLEEDNDILTYLLQHYTHIEIDAKDDEGATALHYAVQIDNWYKAKQLLDHHADQNIARKDGKTPLHFTALFKFNAMLRNLLYTCIIPQLNVVDENQMTPLYLSVVSQNIEGVEILLEFGADPDWRPSDTESMIEFAVNRSPPWIFAALLKKSKMIDSEEISSVVFQAAIANDDEEKVTILLENGVNPNIKWKRENIYVTPLVDVIEKNKPGMVGVLLKFGADVNTVDGYGNTPLHIACMQRRKGNNTTLHRSLEILKLLIENGADVNATHNSNWAPLHCAVSSRNVEFVTFLLEHGADPNIEFKKYKIAPIHLTVGDYKCNPQRRNCIKKENEKILKILLEDERTNVNVKDIYSLTPFDFAVVKNRPDIVELLLKHKADPLAGWNPDGKGLLHFAIKHRNMKILKEILKLEYIPLINLPYDNDAPPLLFAIQKDDLESIILLLEYKADVNLKYESKTVLETAIRKQNQEVIKLVLKVPGLNVNEPSNRGFTPLHLAARYRYKWLVLELLELGADLNATTHDGNSILHIAVLSTFVELVTLLVIKYDMAVDVTNNKGLTPLHLCCLKIKNKSRQQIIMTALLDLEADPSARCNSGNSIIHYLAKSDSIDSIWPINSSFAELIHAENLAGDTPLHFACRALAHKSVMLLLNAGASMTVTNSEDETPIYCYLSSFITNRYINSSNLILGNSSKEIARNMMENLVETQNTVAISNMMKFDKVERWFSQDFLNCLLNCAVVLENAEMIKEFLNSGADINFRREVFFDDSEYINLFLALNNRAILELLLNDENCEVNLPGRNSRTVLHYAVERDLYDEVNRLLEKGANPDCRDNAGLIPYQYAANNPIMEELLLLYGSDPYHNRAEGEFVFSQNIEEYLISRAVLRKQILNDETEINSFQPSSGSHLNKCQNEINLVKCKKRIDEFFSPKLDKEITYEDIVAQDYTKINKENIETINTIINSPFTENAIPLYFKYVRTQFNVMKHSLPIMLPIGRIGMNLKAFLEADVMQTMRYLDNPEVREFLNNTNLFVYTPKYSYELHRTIEAGNNTIEFRNSVIKKLNQRSDSRLAKLPTEIWKKILNMLDWNSLIELDNACS